MKQLTLSFLFSFVTILATKAQMTQTIRGTVYDADAEFTLIGASVIVLDSDPLIGTVTDIDGRFRLENIPIGRVSLKISFMGYEEQLIPNIVVNSAKEVVLNIPMQESVTQMNAVVISANKNKGEALNDMSINSSRSISVEETSRYAGGFNDPSRIVSSFAGVATTGDGGNDIIVRGNSPKYIQWRLEGMQITNPNHFADQNAVGGAVSILNNNMMATSDFHTGAFAPEFGDALSGIYDVKLREGNNEHFETVLGIGLLGTDLTVEGPFKKGYRGSYVANYRYSNASLIDQLGLVDIVGIPYFQDGSFKVVLPTKNIGKFNIYGLGGTSGFRFENVTPAIWNTPGEPNLSEQLTENVEKETFLGNAGLSHVLAFGERSVLRTSVSYSGEGINDDVFITEHLNDENSLETQSFKSRLIKSTYRAALTYSNKINARNKIEVGSKYALFDYEFKQDQDFALNGNLQNMVDFKENISTVRNYVSWKHRHGENLTLVAGIHNMNVLLNNKSTLEPRLGIKWAINPTNSLNLGYGNHSNMESVHNYYTKFTNSNGEEKLVNADLDLLKAHHFILGYEKRFSAQLRAKVELYYQHLYSLPLENNDTSIYSTINEGLEVRYVDLVNEGTGRNYGMELTLERFFHKNYYFLLNGSVYESKYTPLDGIERNTRFNGNYLVNLIGGKEFDGLGKNKNQTLGLNAKVFFGGGKKIIPLVRDGDGNAISDPVNGPLMDMDNAYDKKIEDLYQIIIAVSYKFNRPKATHELFFNLDNITNSKGKISEFYDEREEGNVGYVTQFGFFPNVMYRLYL